MPFASYVRVPDFVFPEQLVSISPLVQDVNVAVVSVDFVILTVP